MTLESITIGTAKWLTKKNGLDGVAIFAFKDGGINAVSYGEHIEQCDDLGRFINYVCAKVLENGKVQMPSLDTGGLGPMLLQGGEYDV